jgi:signal transduction histidine kinase
MTGYGEDDLRQRPLADIRLPDVAADDGTAAALAGELGRRQRYLTHDGRVLQVAASVHVLRDAAGESVGTVGALQDLTDMLRLRQAERDNEQASAANRAKTDFLSRLSHELRAPLNAIIGFAQMLSATDEPHADPVAQQRALAQIRQAGWHLLDMINDVLDLARIESGELRLSPQALSLTEAVQEAFGMVEPIALQADVSLRSRLHEDATLVQADPIRLRQVLLNLLGNGVKYNRRGGFVELRASPDAPGMVLIEVEDNGIGMSELQQAELFTPFNRLGRDQHGAQGTGIGLVICRKLIAAMGGDMSVVSREGEGSTFSFRLPRGRGADGQLPPPRQTTSAGALAPTVTIGRVVYVEDSAADVEVMRGWLHQRPGVELVCVSTGAQGLVEAPTADLMMLDLNLSDMSGLDLLRALKADPHTRGTPVIVVSADALPARIDECFDAGALHYLTKPVDVQQLLHAVDDALRAD